MNWLRWRSTVPLVGILLLVATPAALGQYVPARSSTEQADTHPALNHPDQYAWELFARISQPANNGTNEAHWETWASKQDTMTGLPALKPQWPGTAHRIKELQPSTQLTFLETGDLEFYRLPPPEKVEEIRLDEKAFDFIVEHNLWYIDSVSGNDGLMGFAFDPAQAFQMPPESIAVKAHWRPLTNADDKSRYHWYFDEEQKSAVGLDALHIASRVIPNWFWATFEHMDNPNRCDVIGCHDSFGQNEDGTVTSGLETLFTAQGLGAEWRNYRLNGTQVSFTTSTGVPIRLSNSMIEGETRRDSSCLTCHARAGINQERQYLHPFPPHVPNANGLPGPVLGVPVPEWFASCGEYKQADFLWIYVTHSNGVQEICPSAASPQ